MKKGLFFGLSLFLIALSAFFFQKKNKEATPIANSALTALSPKNEPLRKSPASAVDNLNVPNEDPDILKFVSSLNGKVLGEKLVISLLQQNISQNKKAVVLEFYHEQQGEYRDPKWKDLLLNLIKESNEWPELANKAADCLYMANKNGDNDAEIMETIDSLSLDETVKRSALAYSIRSRSNIEILLNRNPGMIEAEILAKHHVMVLSQEEKLEHFKSTDNQNIRVYYMKDFLNRSSHIEELEQGLKLGSESNLLSDGDKDRLFYSASEAQVPGKTRMLFSLWKEYLVKGVAGDFSALASSLQTSAYSENESIYAAEIIDWLLETKIPPNSTSENPVGDLGIFISNGCGDNTIDQHLCPALKDDISQLRSKMKAAGFGGYIRS